MKAIRIHQFGDSRQLSHDDIDTPHIADDEILIKVVNTSVNPVDWRTRDGYLKDMIPHQLPLTLGWDVAGVVHKTGRHTTQFSAGDHVFALADISLNGAYAEYIAIK